MLCFQTFFCVTFLHEFSAFSTSFCCHTFVSVQTFSPLISWVSLNGGGKRDEILDERQSSFFNKEKQRENKVKWMFCDINIIL